MKFIELKDVFTGNVVHVNATSIVTLASTNCVVDGVGIECCSVTYNIGNAVSSVTVADNCVEIINSIARSLSEITLPAIQGKTLHISEKPYPELFTGLRQFYDSQSNELPDIEEYRTLQRGEKVFPGDKTLNSEGALLQKPTLQDVNPFLLGKTCPGGRKIYRRYVFSTGEAVVLTTNYQQYKPLIVEEVVGLFDHLPCYKLQGQQRYVKASNLAPYIPPQETPPCNGNGTAQKTEE